MLLQKNKKIIIAESMTGGAICAEIVKYPDASRVLQEGFVTYSDEAKMSRLNVPWKLLNEEGAVSPSVCGAMVMGLLENKDVDFALAVTGYADSRSGGTSGLTYIGTVDTRSSSKNIQVSRYLLSGSRNSIRKQAVKEAISLLYTMAKNS
jgi:PncC family amidohydrolase